MSIEKRILIDCSFISTTKLNTGIQRVVRKVIENVYNICENTGYVPYEVVFEKGKTKHISMKENNQVLNQNLVTTENDIILLLDSTWHLNNWDSIYTAKTNGTKIIAVVYDIIPITHPQFCDANLVRLFKQWFKTAVNYVDGFIAISETVQNQLENYLNQQYPEKTKNKKYDFFHLGADFDYKKLNVQENLINSDLVSLYDRNKNIYLIVCTVEPRKNHTYLLDVFDKLWSKDIDVTLNIVGKKGWKVDELISRIQNHSEYKKRLFHWDNLNDVELNYCYQNSKMLLFPSYIEGFGLPIIESLNNKLPVMASDIPIHREVGCDHIAYFDINNVDDLVEKIEDVENNGIPTKLLLDDDFKWLNWAQSTKQLFKKIKRMEKKIKVEKKPPELIVNKASDSNFKYRFKRYIKSVPALGWFIRWTYNLLRLNNIKHILYLQLEKINSIQTRLNSQHSHIKRLEHVIKKQESDFANLIKKQQSDFEKLIKLSSDKDKKVETLENEFLQAKRHINALLEHNSMYHNFYMDVNSKIKSLVSKHISSQSLLFHQKLDNLCYEIKNNQNHKKDFHEQISSSKLDDFYLSFENTFRGDREFIKTRYTHYLKYLSPSIKNALDIGCGRGEWVELLQENSIDTVGIDLNFSMINEGISSGVNNLKKVDAFEYLKSCADNSFDLVSAFHIIEHIPYEKLFVFLEEIKRVATSGATILLETPNPANILVSTHEFYKDPTHLNPLPSDVMKFTLEYLGFEDVKVELLHPFDPKSHVQETSKTANKINHHFYQAQDYLLVSKKKVTKRLSNSSLKKLAYVSPLPPQKSGISKYSSDIVPFLSKYYDIDIIVEHITTDDEWINKNCNVRTVEWLKANHNDYDRVVYHIGNSNYHKHMVELIETVPGTVVLHDFFVSDLVNLTASLNPKNVYELHGYSALKTYLNDENKYIKNFPSNKNILNNSIGAISHSKYQENLLSKYFYKPLKNINWYVVPLLRIPVNKDENLLSRESLGIDKDTFLVTSFGVLGKSKKNIELVKAWADSSLSKKENLMLVFVGGTEDLDYLDDLESSIASFGCKNIRVTGWVDDLSYNSYLAHSSISVQLRANSRGETSASILDCMNYGVATIINDIGSNKELPKDTAYFLDENFTVEELKQALEKLYLEEDTRESISTKAKNYIEKHHTPESCSKLYYEYIEDMYMKKENFLINSVKNMTENLSSDKEKTKTLSSLTFDMLSQKQILVDVSSIVDKDLKTGIQRVVRSQVKELIENSPLNYRIEPVYLKNVEDDRYEYFYAREYTSKILDLDVTLNDEPIDIRQGDIFYALDLASHQISQAIKCGLFDTFRKAGVKVVSMVYDIIPINNPHFFPQNSKKIHTKWLKNIVSISDMIITISNKVANDVKEWIKENESEKLNKIQIISQHLGADISNTMPTLKNNEANTGCPKFLMVGTLEPRKGHEVILKAFEELWKNNSKDQKSPQLHIVGKKGWMVDRLYKNINEHLKLNEVLFYYEHLSDDELLEKYQDAECIIVASEDEGFGLPIIEAAMYDKPVVVRDIDVFREVAKDGAYYFKDVDDPKTVAQDIQRWISLYEKGEHPKPANISYITWEENAKETLKILKEL